MTTQHELLASLADVAKEHRTCLMYQKDTAELPHCTARADAEIAELDALIAEYDNLPPAVAAEPVAWMMEASNDKIRIWWRDKPTDETLTRVHNSQPIFPLYREEPPALSAELTAALRVNAERLRQFEVWADEGFCPHLVFNDNGWWAVTFDGSGSICPETPPPGGEFTAIVESNQWRPTVAEAIDAARGSMGGEAAKLE